MKRHRWMEWSMAARRAALHYGRTAGIAAVIRLGAWAAWVVLRGVLLGDLVSRKVWFSRMLSCARCPLWDRSLHTCGLPGMRDGEDNQLGCLCWMPVKAAIRSSKCWLEEAGYEGRW